MAHARWKEKEGAKKKLCLQVCYESTGHLILYTGAHKHCILKSSLFHPTYHSFLKSILWSYIQPSKKETEGKTRTKFQVYAYSGKKNCILNKGSVIYECMNSLNNQENSTSIFLPVLTYIQRLRVKNVGEKNTTNFVYFWLLAQRVTVLTPTHQQIITQNHFLLEDTKQILYTEGQKMNTNMKNTCLSPGSHMTAYYISFKGNNMYKQLQLNKNN